MVLRLVERAEHARGGVDERVGVPLVVGELSGENARKLAAAPVPPENGGYDLDGALRTSQKKAPARPLDCTYCALSLAILGVSNETNSRFDASYE